MVKVVREKCASFCAGFNYTLAEVGRHWRTIKPFTFKENAQKVARLLRRNFAFANEEITDSIPVS
jgi:hypothetical protein